MSPEAAVFGMIAALSMLILALIVALTIFPVAYLYVGLGMFFIGGTIIVVVVGGSLYEWIRSRR